MVMSPEAISLKGFVALFAYLKPVHGPYPLEGLNLIKSNSSVNLALLAGFGYTFVFSSYSLVERRTKSY